MNIKQHFKVGQKLRIAFHTSDVNSDETIVDLIDFQLTQLFDHKAYAKIIGGAGTIGDEVALSKFELVFADPI
jgi:hypothetical protein